MKKIIENIMIDGPDSDQPLLVITYLDTDDLKFLPITKELASKLVRKGITHGS